VPEDVYRSLAERLDAIPNGFTAAESGADLQLLKKIFAPEEAGLAAVMRLTHEPAAVIADRAGVEPRAARRTLKGMVRKGLIGIKRGESKLLFGLIPFVFGIYEFQLPRMDTEMARLFEQYMQETKGGSIIQDAPAIHRVVPVAEAIPFDLEVFPYERAVEMIETAKSWGVRDCICRVQQKLVGKGCEHTIENCLSFLPIENAFDGSEEMRAITKEEALRILKEAADEGLVHSTGNYRDGNFYVCNCCTCCCGLVRGIAEFDIPTAVAHSDFRAVVDEAECIGCEDCIERCQFEALTVPEDVCLVDHSRCVGCGVCVISCPADALSLERRPGSDTLQVPADDDEWMTRRAEERGISLSEIR
jgi:Pyruvate/2-oxoacid:ferredoxin oxidoreductase delta subunit